MCIMFFSKSAGDKFVDRGNVTPVDFSAGSLTADGSWHELDLSSIIPVGTKLVMLRTSMIAIATIGVLKVKKNGLANDINVDISSMETDGFPKFDTLYVVPDADGKIEYWYTNAAYAIRTITVGGWFI